MAKLKKAFDIGSTIKLLREMEGKGLLAKEDLDQPSQGYLIATGQRWNHITKEVEWHDYRTPQGSKSVMPKHQIPQHRNLLRDPEPLEAVEASADARDFEAGQVPAVRPGEPQVLLPEDESLHTKVNQRHPEDLDVFEPVPF